MYEYLQAYLSKDIYPFHMPGHKRNPMFFPIELASFDLTEIPGMDNLRAPTGILRDLQFKIAEFYDADTSYILVNGASTGIMAAICTCTGSGSKLYAARNGHVSMYNGMAFSETLPIYVQPETTPDGIAGGINPQALDSIEEGSAVIVVSPTYEGFVSDIKSIAEKVHSRGGILIVDEAHGVHFPFHKAFPDSAIKLGADIVVQSFHKTLPALGQLAVLHVKGSRIDTAKLKFYLNAMQTTSPSYMLIAQLDYMFSILWNRAGLFDMYVSRLNNLRNALASSETRPIELVGTGLIGNYGIHDIDRGKLLFRLNIDESAENISKILADEYRLQFEMAAGRHLLAMTSVADTDEGIQKLWATIGALNIKLEATAKNNDHIDMDSIADKTSANSGRFSSPGCYSIPELVLTPWQAARLATETIPWEASAGRIAGEVIAAYPPGIALVAPGERIPDGLPKLTAHIRVVK